MNDIKILLNALKAIGFTDDSGNSIPTCEKRYCNKDNEIVIGDGYNICVFKFDKDGIFFINEHQP